MIWTNKVPIETEVLVNWCKLSQLRKLLSVLTLICEIFSRIEPPMDKKATKQPILLQFAQSVKWGVYFSIHVFGQGV